MERGREVGKQEGKKERRNDLMKGEMQGDCFYMKTEAMLSLKPGTICRSPNLPSLLDVVLGGKAGTIGNP